MYDRICDYLTTHLLSDEQLNSEERLVYAIGIDVALSTGISVLIVCVIGGLLGDLIGAVLFLTCFLEVRNFCGGYHAKTRLGCLSALCICFLAVEAISPYVRSCVVMAILYLVYLTIFIQNRNTVNSKKRFTEKLLLANRRRLFLSVGFWTVFSAVMLGINQMWAIKVCLTMTTVAILSAKGGNQHEENEKSA